MGNGRHSTKGAVLSEGEVMLARLLGMHGNFQTESVACSGGREGEREAGRQTLILSEKSMVFQLSHPCLRLSSGRGRCQRGS